MHAYCDNWTVFGAGKKDVQQLASQIIEGVESEGFVMHEKVAATDCAVSVGV